MPEATLKTMAISHNLAGKSLAFTRQGEAYGIEGLKRREIIRHLISTAVPQMDTTPAPAP